MNSDVSVHEPTGRNEASNLVLIAKPFKAIGHLLSWRAFWPREGEYCDWRHCWN